MPSTQLIYFGETEDSKYGTARGFVAIVPIFLILLASSYVYTPVSPCLWDRLILVGLASLVLCSAVGVQLPRSYIEAGLYGGLVGFVVSVCCLCFLMLAGRSLGIRDMLAVPLLICTLAFVSILTMWISQELGLYRGRPKSDSR